MESIATYANGSAQGDLLCKSKLGEFYLLTALSTAEKEKAFEILRDVSNAGDLAASWWIALRYEEGFVMQRNETKARQVWIKALRRANEVLTKC